MVESAGGSPRSLPLDELRAERARLQATEDAVSYARRVAQARLDLVTARLENGQRPVADQLRDVLSHQLLSPSGRPPRPTDDHATGDVAQELEAICAEHGFSRLDSLESDELAILARALTDFEERVSAERRRLFESIDALSADLVRRYRDGSASVDGLWEAGDDA